GAIPNVSAGVSEDGGQDGGFCEAGRETGRQYLRGLRARRGAARWLAQPKLGVTRGGPPLRVALRRGSLRTGTRAKAGVPNGIRTRVLALKGPRPGPLDDGDIGGW